MNQRVWLLILLVVVGCGGVIWLVSWRRSHSLTAPAAMLGRLPTQDAVVLFIDFNALRRAGIVSLMSRTKISEEPEYQAFVQSTDFDWKQDLDSAFVSFRPEGTFMLVRGRFDWKKLQSYARQQRGSCYNTLCRMTGSAPNRKISFFPLEKSLMALAVSADDFAATRLQERSLNARPIAPQAQPIWISVPAKTLKESDNFPAGTRMFAKAMQDAENVVISVGPSGRQYEASLEVICRSAQDASGLTAQLERATALLRDMIARERKQPNPNDLSGVLTAGVFGQQDRRVFGRWPIAPGFIEALAGGTL